MFKSKRRKSSIRKVEKDDSNDSGVEIDLEMLKMEQKLRNEMKCGLSTDELLKSKNGYIDPLDNKSDAEDNDATTNDSVKDTKDKTKQTIDDQRLMDYIADDKLLFKPDGLVIHAINPKPIVSSNDRKEIEEKTDGRRETIEELLEMKKQLTIDLKRERRMERERLGLI